MAGHGCSCREAVFLRATRNPRRLFIVARRQGRHSIGGRSCIHGLPFNRASPVALSRRYIGSSVCSSLGFDPGYFSKTVALIPAEVVAHFLDIRSKRSSLPNRERMGAEVVGPRWFYIDSGNNCCEFSSNLNVRSGEGSLMGPSQTLSPTGLRSSGTLRPVPEGPTTMKTGQTAQMHISLWIGWGTEKQLSCSR